MANVVRPASQTLRLSRPRTTSRKLSRRKMIWRMDTSPYVIIIRGTIIRGTIAGNRLSSWISGLSQLSCHMKVAIQGELGSFSHEAARRMVTQCTVIPCARSLEVFDRVERGTAAAAVIPIENTLAGTVAEHADLLVAREVFVQGEFLLRIVHNVIAAPGVKLRSVRGVLSHPVALDQCRDFFQSHPRIEPVPFYDTAGSVKHVLASRLKDAAGIAGRQAAREYGGKIVLAGIEDDKRNYTRFFLLRKGNTKVNNPVLNKRERLSGNASSTSTPSRLMPPRA